MPAATGPRSLMVELAPPPGVRAAFAAGPATIYLNRGGGSYLRGQPNDSRTNVTSVPPDSVSAIDIPAWQVGDEEWEDLKSCVGGLFGPFAATVTDQDPGGAPHLEAVLGGDPISMGLDPSVAGVSPFLTDCSVIDNSIVFIFPVTVGGDGRRLCETVAQEVAHSFGLDHEFLCEDPMTYLTGCGDKEFIFHDAICGEFEPRDCKCGETQNSARLLLERLGRGQRPAVWLSQPYQGDVLAAGFPVTAAFTYPPTTVDLYIDGIYYDSAIPDGSGGAYQEVEFETSYLLRSGTHHVEVVARYGSEEGTASALVEVVARYGSDAGSASALVEVEAVQRDDLLGRGCAAGGRGAGGGAAALLAAVIAIAIRRRHRQLVRSSGRTAAARVAILTAVACLSTGCLTEVLGGEPTDIESGCQAAEGASAAVGVLWSPTGGVCTATLIGTRTLVTAAHCVAAAADGDEPLVIVLGDRQYIAERQAQHPSWVATASGDDVAVLLTSVPVVDVDPFVVDPAEPVLGDEVTLVGHGDWSPAQVRDAERQAQVTEVSAVEERGFAYEDDVEEGCLSGRGGGLVMAGDDLVGIHGVGQVVMRADTYGCWTACVAAGDLAEGGVAGGCDCARADVRQCGDCGAEYLDAFTSLWSACEPAEDRYPCESGLVCDAEAQTCVPPPV